MLRRFILALAVLFLAATASLPATAQVTVGPARAAVLSRQAAYPQGAIAFDNFGNLTVQGAAATGLSDSSVGWVSFWYRCGVGASGVNAPNTCNVMPIISNLTSSAQDSEGVSGMNVVIDNASGNYGTFRVNLNDATGGHVAAHSCNAILVSAQPSNVWIHWFIAFDFTSSNKLVIYKSGVLAQSGCNSTNYTGSYPLTIHLANTAGFSILAGNWSGTGNLNSGAPGQGEMSDLQMDFTSTPIVGTTVPAPTLGRFILNGLPVDPGANCARAFGYQPQFCYLYGKASFFTNRGSLGQAGMTQASSAQNVIYNAGSTPLDPTPAHRVYRKWLASLTGTGITTTATISTGGNTIAVGDLLVLALSLRDTSRTTGVHTMPCPMGFTQQYRNWNNGGSNNGFPLELLVCTRIADGSDAGASTTYTSTWSVAPTSGARWVLADYGGADQTTPIDAAAGLPASGSDASSSGTNFTASTSVVAPAITPTVPSDLLLSIYNASAGATTTAIAAPADEDQRIKMNSNPQILFAERQLTNASATPTETATYGSTQGSNAASLLIRPGFMLACFAPRRRRKAANDNAAKRLAA